MSVTVVIGTDRGGFVLRSDERRRKWKIDGPIFKGWKLTAVTRAANGVWLAGTTSDVYGCAIHTSHDLSQWRQIDHGPSYAEGGERKLTQIWKLLAHDGECYAGVSEAGLFRSRDGGETWQPLDGLNQHRTRDAWCPGTGGLCAHAILVDPKNAKRIWCGISAVGVFRSDDGGESWHTKNDGVPVILEDKNHPDIGYCVHALAQDPDQPERIYRQDHQGVFRSNDAGDHWERIENGLPSGFGFPIVRDHRGGALFTVPLESDEYRIPIDGRLRVFRSRDAGESWTPLSEGLPSKHVYASVMRGAMDADQLDPCGIYVGTTSGDVFVSADAGDHWTVLPYRLPRIHCLTAIAEV